MSLIACPECTKQISSFAPYCPGCGCPIKASDDFSDSGTPHVVIDDINMGFANILAFMIKAMIAAIPAGLIFLLIAMLVMATFGK